MFSLFGFYLILLLSPISEAAEAICGEEVCGNVTIPYPFGIKRNCYPHPSFRVSCQENKPFININGINLELLSSFFENTVNVNYPVTYVNCDRKLGITGADVDLAGSPFFLPGYYNYFGSAGCGNWATISTNRGDSVVGCMQPVCGSDGGGGFYTEIVGTFTSYSVSTRNMNGSERRSCATAFMYCSAYFDAVYPLPVEINSATTHVPATLQWDSTSCGDNGCEVGRPDIINENSCGDVNFEYPFGVRSRKHSKSRFEVMCNETADGEHTPFININGIDQQILEFSFFHGTVVVNHSITYFNCRRNNNNGMSLNLKGTPFYYSDIHTIFWSPGCGNLVTVFDETKRNHIGGCSQPSCRIRKETSSTTGCRVVIPRGLNSFFANMTDAVNSSDLRSKRSCGFASPVYSDLYYNLTESSEDIDTSDWTYVSTSLQWGTPKRGSCRVNQGSDTSCSSDGQYCWNSLNSTHLCVCAVERVNGQETFCEGTQLNTFSITVNK
ncbi:uncharacterized protein LOC120150402 [Hibiscus syriacus]|uniref:uncharacterized protein LOC120150402 n=1 Tax=Hibiscus syriacus TaxID=106335 RepID=UPI0019211BC5|nr:uncharacterized protein LOC120150402 [Hibiscus syriacus]